MNFNVTFLLSALMSRCVAWEFFVHCFVSEWPDIRILDMGIFDPFVKILCLTRLSFWVAWYSHSGQGNVWPIWTDFLCWKRLPFFENCCIHSWQGNFWHVCTDLLWLSMLPFSFDWYSQSEHWNCMPSWVAWMCSLRVLLFKQSVWQYIQTSQFGGCQPS